MRAIDQACRAKLALPLSKPHRGAARRLAGEVGLANAPRPGPGSVRVGLLDALHLMGEAEVLAGAKVKEVA
jgi:hydroxyethylthiazole kinase